ncbi:hypothetical protein BKA56DRAFT_574780 [Ilyonectria sp. MPI-CAGE-AT-0026]|nr:hypothetical protein BKA56DRAFT_574780 [Ilyonectria sp. MPI-CAGE-AT-0026]
MSRAVYNVQVPRVETIRLGHEENKILQDALHRLLYDLNSPETGSIAPKRTEPLDPVPQTDDTQPRPEDTKSMYTDADTIAEKQNPIIDFTDSIASLFDSTLSPEDSLRSAVFLRNRRRLKPSPPRDPFWLNPKFQRWKEEHDSSLIVIKCTFSHRFLAKDFCVDAIESIRETGVAVHWALNVPVEDESKKISIIDVLKSLTSQALRTAKTGLFTKDYTNNISAQIRNAGSEDDWLHILSSALLRVRQAVIIVDIELCPPSAKGLETETSLPAAFLTLLRILGQDDATAVAKVILIGYASWTIEELTREGLKDFVLEAGRAGKYKAPVTKNSRGTRERIASNHLFDQREKPE